MGGYRLPVPYDYRNIITSSIQPNTFRTQGTVMFSYFAKYLLEEAMSPIKFTVPDTWAENYFLYVLYCNGFIGVMETNKFGVICQHGTLQGYNVFYQPMRLNVVNPLFKKTYSLKIDKECALIRLQPDYSGILDIVGYYADLLTLASTAAHMNLINSKLAFLIGVGNKAEASAMKMVVDKVMQGETAVWYDTMYKKGNSGLSWDMFNNDVGGNYITDKLMESMRTIHNMFLTDVGIPNSNFEKSERLLQDEINANNVETKTKCQLWYESIKKGIDSAKKLFPEINLNAEWRRFDEGNNVDVGAMDMGRNNTGHNESAGQH